MLSQSTPVQIPLLARDGFLVGHTLVDAADVDFVNQWTWRLLRSGLTGEHLYASRGARVGGVYRKILLHRELLGLPQIGREPQVDHRDHDGLNNVRANLRVVTQAENGQNKNMLSNNTSGYRGVSWLVGNQRWIAHATIDQHLYYLGSFLTAEAANDTVVAWRRANMPYSIEP